MPIVHDDVKNLRITFVPAAERRPEADWAGDVIRIQAYRDPSVNQALMMGPEFPVETEADLERLFDTIRQVFRQGRESSPR